MSSGGRTRHVCPPAQAVGFPRTLNPEGSAVAAISLSGWINRMHTDRLAPAVRTTALTLSRPRR